MERVAKLERRLTAAGGEAHLNELTKLYELCESDNLEVIAVALQAIGRVMSHHRQRVCRAKPPPTACVEEDDASKQTAEFLRRHTDAYHATLSRLAANAAPRAQVCALRLAMNALRCEAVELGPGASLVAGRSPLGLAAPNRRVQDLISEMLLGSNWGDHLVSCLAEEYVSEFADVRHHVVCHLRACAEYTGRAQAQAADGTADAAPAVKRRKTHVGPFVQEMRKKDITPVQLFSRLFDVLRVLPEPEPAPAAGGEAKQEDEDDDEEGALLAPGARLASSYRREYRKAFQDAWVQLLGLRVPLEHCVPLLQMLPNKVLPHMSQPLMLADFYLRAFSAGSIEVGVLSLSGLLTLLTKHGLGDPETLSAKGQEFYTQLYSLLKIETFQLKRRARFQRLLVASVSSGLLPGAFAAAFAKKCMSIAVCCTDPGAVMWLISVAYTLIQRHHSKCKYLLHDPDRVLELPGDHPNSDPFDVNAPLADACVQVEKTSLWEVEVLRLHHMEGVHTLAKSFLQPFFTPLARKLDPDLFLDQGFESSFQQALKRGQRQMYKIKSKGDSCPVAFKADDDEIAAAVFGTAAALSTMQRRVGTVL